MGAWGPAIFSDDLACDVRDEFKDLIGDGLTEEAATSRLLVEYHELLDDPDQASVFWISLALTQHRLGRVVGPVRDEAIAAIDSGADPQRWDGPMVSRRTAALSKARAELLGPARQPVAVRKRIKSSTPFEAGDIVSYRQPSGRALALWVRGNKTDKGGTYSRVQLAAIGDPELPPIDTIVQSDPPLVEHAPGPSSPLNLLLMRCQNLPEARCQIIGNRPWPGDGQPTGGSTAVFCNPPPRQARLQRLSLDAVLARLVGS